MSETLAAEGTSPSAESSDQESATTGAATSTAGESESSEETHNPSESLVQEGDVAGDYLEQLLDVLDYDGDIDLDVEAGRAMVSIDGGDELEKLVGQRGAVLEALQELTRLAVQQDTGVRSRLMLDVAGWRASRRDELSELGKTTAEKVVESGERVRLQVMTPFERKVVHDAVYDVKGAQSESEGEEPRRRVVVLPAD